MVPVGINYFSLSGLVNLVLSFIIGSFVLYKNPKSPIHRNFAYFCFGAVGWSFGYVMWQFSPDEPRAYIWAKFLMIGAALAPLFYFTFVMQFLNLLYRSLYRYLFYGAHALTYIFILINIFSPLLIDHVEQRSIIRYWPMGGPALIPFLILFFGQVIIASFLLFVYYRKSKGIQRIRIWYIAFGITIAFLGGSTNYFLFFDATPIPPFGTILVSTYPMCVGYAITRYRFMDIRIILKKSVVYGGALVIALALFMTATFFIYQALDSIVVWMMAMSIMFFIQPLFRKRVKIFLDGIFFHNELDLSKKLSESMHRLESVHELHLFIEELTTSIKRIVPVDTVHIFVREHEHARYRAFSVSEVKGINIPFDEPVLDELRQRKSGFLVRDEVEQRQEHTSQLRKFFTKHHTHLVMRLGNILGLVMMSYKTNNKPFTTNELQQLEYLRMSSTTALQHILEWHETMQRAAAFMQNNPDRNVKVYARLP